MSKLADYPFEIRPLTAEEEAKAEGVSLNTLALTFIHTASKASWYEIADELPQFAEFPPEEFWSEYE